MSSWYLIILKIIKIQLKHKKEEKKGGYSEKR